MNDVPDTKLKTMSRRSGLLSAASMTPAERAIGRFMRAPDHGPADASPPADVAPPAADAPTAGAPSVENGGGADEGTVLGGEAAPEGDPAPDGNDQPPQGAPEAYDLKAPDGMELDTEALALAEPVLRDLNLSNEAAQKLTDVYAQIVPKVAERYEAAQTAAITAQRTAWAAEAKADPEIGGAKWAESTALSAKALDTLGAPAGSPFRQFLNDSGLGNHVEMIRMFAKVGKIVGEDDAFVPSRTTTPKSREDKYYGSASS